MVNDQSFKFAGGPHKYLSVYIVEKQPHFIEPIHIYLRASASATDTNSSYKMPPMIAFQE